jgi:hypothetical protein
MTNRAVRTQSPHRALANPISALCLAGTALGHALLALALFGAPAAAQRAGSPGEDDWTRPARQALHAARAPGGERPIIDGSLDDAAWALADVATGFTQLRPDPGLAATQRTEVRVLYDDDAIYIAARMFDTSPDSIAAQLTRRDQSGHSDYFYVALDSYFDRRTAFVFGLSPAGVKHDMLIFNDTQQDRGWDAVWDGAARVDSLGWTAEFRIPLSQLRFSSAENGDGTLVWGVNFLREIARRNEQAFWAEMKPDVNRMVSVFGELRGLQGLTPARHLELLPYASSRATRAPANPGNPFHRATAGTATAGLDLKYGITSDLTLTATVNPDFGQVEADPSQVNLSAYETFLPERRPFFLEGTDIFHFGIGIGDGDLGNEALFYSRRIGRFPHGGVPGSARHADLPGATTILGAAKLSGKTADGWSLGMLSALTAPEQARYATADGLQHDVAVEPMTHYAVARALRDFRAGRSALGTIATATNRRIDDERLDFLHTAAYTGGVNGRHRFGSSHLELSGWLLGSRVEGSEAALRRTQVSSRRYFHRPDAEHLGYDSLATSMNGWAGSLQLFKFSGGHWRYGAATIARSPGFEANDLGFQRDADQIFNVGFVGYEQYKAGSLFRRWSVNTNQWHVTNFGGERLGLGANMNMGGQFLNYTSAHLGIARDLATVSPRALRGGPALAANPRANAWFSLSSDSRKPVRGGLNGNLSREDGTDGRFARIAPYVNIRPSTRADFSLQPSIVHNTDAWQFVATRTAADADHYVFGRIEQTTAALTARVNYTFTPALSLQFYAQPFISAGAYSEFRAVTDPRAARFDDRFRTYAGDEIAYDADARRYRVDANGDGVRDFSFANPDFNVKQLRSNAVLRWEYRPGSSLFLVWSHGRGRADEFGSFDLGRDASDLLAAKPTNVFLIKATYWLGM